MFQEKLIYKNTDTHDHTHTHTQVITICILYILIFTIRSSRDTAKKKAPKDYKRRAKLMRKWTEKLWQMVIESSRWRSQKKSFTRSRSSMISYRRPLWKFLMDVLFHSSPRREIAEISLSLSRSASQMANY